MLKDDRLSRRRNFLKLTGAAFCAAFASEGPKPAESAAADDNASNADGLSISCFG